MDILCCLQNFAHISNATEDILEYLSSQCLKIFLKVFLYVYNYFCNFSVKKVASEGVSDDPDESMSAKISDTEETQKDAQTVEQQSLTLSGQDSEQIALEPDLTQKKRRRKNQDEASKQEVKNLPENAVVQPGASKGEKQKSEFLTYFNSPCITEKICIIIWCVTNTYLLDSSN